MSSFFIFLFLGMKKRNTIIENDSLNILSNIYMVMVIIGPYLIILGSVTIIISNLNNCSRMLLIIWGVMFCLP